MRPQTFLPHVTLVGLTLAAGIGLGAGCQPSAPDQPVVVGEQPSFYAIQRDPGESTGDIGTMRSMLSAAPAGSFDPSQSFYLAINKRELGKRFFLSAYIKQWFPDAVLGAAARSLGTRVVSFKIQNGKLYIFDVDDRKQTSDTFGIDQIIEAYPIVNVTSRLGLPLVLDDFVVVDPAAGLNHFGVVSDAFGSFGLGFPDRFIVELAFSQRFRALPDGATYEQAFTGYTDRPRDNLDHVDPNFFRASGVLGLSLRAYRESDGYVATPPPPQTNYFLSDPALVPNTGLTSQVAIKWNIQRGAAPIKWLISPLAAEVGRSPALTEIGVNLVGAIKAGIESWNAAFGFKALSAELAKPDDSFADDDKNYLIYDVNPSVGFAFADLRTNPNTGEVRGATVYFNDIFVSSSLDSFPESDAAAQPTAAPATPSRKFPSLVWAPLPPHPLCDLQPRLNQARVQASQGFGPGTPATRKARIEKLIAHIVAHEIGHTLGLRHNFKGTLVPPTSSIMDYTSDADAVAGAVPAAYDVAAIRYLYGLSTALPTQPFCTDEDVEGDARCARFDTSDDPLRQWHALAYDFFLDLYLATGIPFFADGADFYLTGVVKFIQRGEEAVDRSDAFNIAFDRLRVPVPPEALASSPAYGPGVDTMTQRVLNQLFPEPPPANAPPPSTPLTPPPPLDDAVSQLLATELHGNILNLDGIRSFTTRRQAIDVLKRMQNIAGFEALRDVRSVLRLGVGIPDDQLALVDDLIARIDRAVAPYFEH